MPFKVHRAKSPYDKVNKTMVMPHLFPFNKKDKTAFWKGFDWQKAIEAGMKYAGQKYSGEYGFVENRLCLPVHPTWWPRAKNALQCVQCHSKSSRLGNLTGFYMPGRGHLRCRGRGRLVRRGRRAYRRLHPRRHALRFRPEAEGGTRP